MPQLLQRAVVAMALLAGGLLLLGGLLADVESGLQDAAEQAQEYWVQPAPEDVPPDFEPPNDLKGQASRVEALQFASDVDIDVPPGTHLDGDTLEFQRPTTITLPAGTTLEDLSLVLPAGTYLDLGERPRVMDDTLVLGPHSNVVLPDGNRLVLDAGGRLSEHGLDVQALREAVSNGSLRLQEPARLHAPTAVTTGQWQIHLEEGSRLKLNQRGASASDIDGETITTDHTRTRAMAGSTLEQPHAQVVSYHAAGAGPHAAMHDGDDSTGAQDDEERDTLGSLSALEGIGTPPVWSWALLAASATGLIASLLIRRAYLAIQRKKPAFEAALRLDEREEGLPLGLAPGQSATLHVRLIAPGGRHQRRLEASRVQIRLNGKKVHHGNVQTNAIPLPLAGLKTGDHPLEIQVRRHIMLPASRLETLIRVAPWPQQLARDYQSFVDTLGRRHGALGQGATPRQVKAALCELLPNLDPQTPSRLICGFEEANYSPRTITETDWLRFTQTIKTCHAGLDARIQTRPSPSPHEPKRHPPATAPRRRTPG